MENVIPGDGAAPWKIDWFATLWMVGIHGMAISTVVLEFTWTGALVAAMFYLLTGVGITVGFHRLLSHRSFKSPQWLIRLLATLGTLALQGGPIQWVARHRMHHAGVDTDADPHNAKKGFWYCHMGWILLSRPQFDDHDRLRKFARDLVCDPYIAWLSTVFGQTFIQFIPMLLIFLFLGFEAFCWAFFVRVCLLYHCTWTVNSLTHMFGYRRFETADDSRNNWFVALLTFGEGWHNNHHAYPEVAQNGKGLFEFDVSWQLIWLLRKLGLAWDVKTWEWAGSPDDGPPWQNHITQDVVAPNLGIIGKASLY